MSENIYDILNRFQQLNEGLSAQQRSVPQLPAMAHAKPIKVLGAKTDPDHPFDGYMVGAGESVESNDEPVEEGMRDGVIVPDTPWDLGWKAGHRHQDLSDNPYEATTPEHAAWIEGYKEAKAQPHHYDETVAKEMSREDILAELKELDENLRDWFKEKWVRMDTKGNIKGDCARGSESEGKPKCLPQAKAHALGKKGRAAAAQKKRREDPNPERRGAAINVATKVQKEEQLDEKCWDGYHKEGTKKLFGKTVPNCVKNESLQYYVENRVCPHCNGEMVAESALSEKQDACYHKVKSRYKVWPSAYASGALVQCRKKGAKNWGNKSESVAEGEVTEDTIRPGLVAALKQQGFKGPFELGQLPAWKKGFKGGLFDDSTHIMIKGNNPEYSEWVAKGLGYGYSHGVENGYQNNLTAKQVLDAVNAIAEGSEQYYAIVHKVTKKPLSTHRDLESAKDEWRGLDQNQRPFYRVVATKTAPTDWSVKSEGVAEADLSVVADTGPIPEVGDWVKGKIGAGRFEGKLGQIEDIQGDEAVVWMKSQASTVKLPLKWLVKVGGSKFAESRHNELDTPAVQAALKKMAERHKGEKWSKEQLAALGKRIAARDQKPVKEDVTKEDIISKLKDRLGDYLSDISKEIKKDPDLVDKLAAKPAGDQIGPPVKTITTDDGHEIQIHGNEDDGFRISIKNKPAATKFKNLDEAVMACEMYCSRRRSQQQNADYVDEA